MKVSTCSALCCLYPLTAQTKTQAMESFKARKVRQIEILKTQLANAETALAYTQHPRLAKGAKIDIKV